MKIYFTEKNVSSDLEAIEVAGSVLVQEGRVMPEFITACTDREKIYPTGLGLPSGQAVAMPHGESSFVKEDSISIVRTQTPVVFKRMEDPDQTVKCQLIFNLALATGGKHITVLIKLMGLFQDEMFIQNCMQYDNISLIKYVCEQLEEG